MAVNRSEHVSRALSAAAEPWLRHESSALRPVRTTLRFVRRKPLGAFGALVLLALVFTAIFAPLIATHDPFAQERSAVLVSPGSAHWFGGDNVGRDVFSRVVYGARISVTVGMVAVAIGILGGTTVGLISAYWGRWVDMLIQRLMDAIMAFPTLVLALAVVALLGPSIRNIMLAIGFVLIPAESRVVRGAVLSIKENQYVEAARACGATDRRIILRHILPNVVPVLIVLASIRLGGAILTEASLSFLGLGTPPPNPSWGQMLSQQGRLYFETAPWMALFPGIAISLSVLGINLFGDALRDVLDPRLRGS
jgi:peptide/nickel transport system permease protein